MHFSSFRIALRKNKTTYYIRNVLRQAIPRRIMQARLETKLRSVSRFPQEEIFERVNYYNRLHEKTVPGKAAIRLADVGKIQASSAYLYDTLQYSRYFQEDLQAAFLFGDITHVAATPSIQKSRPVSSANANAVLLNLDKKRHFLFLNDPVPYKEKRDMMIGRGVMTQPHRIDFMDKYFGHPLVDLGQVNKSGGKPEWIKPKISIYEHLKYKFVLSLEGNDVATNLKWIMSSNSVAVMPQPKYETWFMEGRLIPDVHYIRIRDDYADLPDVLDFYIGNPQAVKRIVQHANDYVRIFQNQEKEDLISLLVLQKYFYYTSQTSRLTTVP